MIDAEIIRFSNKNDLPNQQIIATVGFFDGVHVGHRFLIRELQLLAAERNALSMVFTFSEHPRKVLNDAYIPRLLNTLDEKKALLQDTGIDYLTVIDFTREFSQLTAESFIQTLSEQFHVNCLLIGYDHRFGRNRTAGFAEYTVFGEKYGMEIIQSSAFELNGVQISATLIRKLLETGDVQLANEYLTYPYCLKGTVIAGNRVGRTIGFPTANLQPECNEKIFPAVGVYAVRIQLDNEKQDGMMNIGYRPTLGLNDELSFEVNLFDFQQELYGKSLTVEFIGYVRGEIKFENTEQLKNRLESDRDQVKKILRTCS